MPKRKLILLLFLTFSSLIVLEVIFLLIIKDKNSQSKSYQEEAIRINEECLSGKGGNCYEAKFKELTKLKGLSFAEQTLYKLWDIDQTTRRCHVLSHVIAKEATRQHPLKWREYLESVNYTTCSAGFLHGVLEAHIGDDPNFKLNSNFINELCFKGEYYKKQNCVHYMGHLYMLEYDGDVNQALDGCEGIKEDLYRRCYTGVFMEDSFPLGLVEHQIRSKLPDRQSLEFIKTQKERCLHYDDDRAVACWTDMGENFGVFYGDGQKVYDACFAAPNQKEGTECFLKAAGLLAIDPKYSNSDKLISICKPSEKDNELYKLCIGRMISSLLYYSPKFSERGITLCLASPQWYRGNCFAELNRQLKKIIPEAKKREEFCHLIPDDHKDLCY